MILNGKNLTLFPKQHFVWLLQSGIQPDNINSGLACYHFKSAGWKSLLKVTVLAYYCIETADSFETLSSKLFHYPINVN